MNMNNRIFIKSVLFMYFLLSASWMSAQVTFLPFPKAGDKYWQKQVPVAMRNDYIRLGNLYQKKPWNAIPNSMFAEFRTMVTAPDTRRLALASESSLSVW